MLRLMREHGLRAPSRGGTVRGPRSHEGTDHPGGTGCALGTDLTGTWISQDGGVSIMLTVDHHNVEILHAAQTGDPLGGTRVGTPGRAPLLWNDTSILQDWRLAARGPKCVRDELAPTDPIHQ